MKIFILTAELSEKNGWGRYSLDLMSALEESGVETVFIKGLLPDPMTYKIYYLAFWYAWKLRRQAKDCDLVHSLIEPYSHIAYWLSIFTGKKYFVTAHGTWSVIPYNFSFAKRRLHKKSFERATKIICVSHYTQKRLSKFGLKNLTVINNGINIKKFSQDPFSSPASKENFIVSVGALKYGKGHHVAIEAFAKVCSEFNNLAYYIVGDQSDTAYFNSLRQLLSNLTLDDKVKFLQKISDEELIDLYRKARLFVLVPISRSTDFEGFGLVYLEAGACGLPVIGTEDSGAADAIKDGETGFLVSQDNSEVVAEVILKILRNEDMALKLSQNGLRWSRDHDWGNVILEYLKEYQSS